MSPLAVKKPKLKPKPSPDPLGHVENVVCIRTLRPSAVSRRIEVGDYLRRDNPIVAQFPEYFAVPLTDLIDAEK